MLNFPSGIKKVFFIHFPFISSACLTRLRLIHRVNLTSCIDVLMFNHAELFLGSLWTEIWYLKSICKALVTNAVEGA